MSDLSPDNKVKSATLDWDESGQPLSAQFGDVYFSKSNGLLETRHVFLQHNQLESRWRELKPFDQFVIAETGFGSGLNFLAAWQLWEQTAPETAQLHFVSVEKYPLTPADLAKALALWPELHKYTNTLIEAYPNVVCEGFQRLKFAKGRVTLTLIIDDAATGFEKLLASTHPLFRHKGVKVNAWFLDGFAPSKNPDMWRPELFQAIADLSETGTTAATFSAAAIVKNGLKSAGFLVEKVAGFGKKREMVKAIFNHHLNTPIPEDYEYKGSFSPYPIPWSVFTPTVNSKRIAIIGAGLAGCHTARQLADRGYHVSVYERHTQPAQEGSGNPQGALYAKLSPLNEAQAAFNLAALEYSQGFYRSLWSAIGKKTGLLQLAFKPQEAKLHQDLYPKFCNAKSLVQFVNAEQASAIAGIELPHSGLFFPEAGWINPSQLCQELLNHPNISVDYGAEITDICQKGNEWELAFEQGQTHQFPQVVIACAREAKHFSVCASLPIKAIRGQVTYIPEPLLTAPIKTVICAEGYISPALQGSYCTGATFNLGEDDLTTTTRDHQTNINNLKSHLANITTRWDEIQPENLEGRAAFRCSFPDYLPAVGPLPNENAMLTDFAPLRKNARAGITKAGSYLSGLYVNIGHGARGLAYTPICAELLAAQIHGEPLPLPQELASALNPARFLIRDIIRSKR